MSELTEMVEKDPNLSLLSPTDGSTTKTIRAVFVAFNDKGKAVITDAFETWEPNEDNPTQDYTVKRLRELDVVEVLDALVITSKVGDDLEAERYKVTR
jgi:hypothetical protein